MKMYSNPAAAVGSVAVQFARHVGAKVYATTSTRNIDYVCSSIAKVL